MSKVEILKLNSICYTKLTQNNNKITLPIWQHNVLLYLTQTKEKASPSSVSMISYFVSLTDKNCERKKNNWN